MSPSSLTKFAFRPQSTYKWLTSSLRSRSIWITTPCLVFCLFSATAQATPQDNEDQILADQERLKTEYELLEEKLFSLYQYEQDENPARAELLQRAYQLSQQSLTREQMQSAVQSLRAGQLRSAEQNQKDALEQLHALLALLQSEDRSLRVKEEIDRHQQYLEEVNRLLRIQQGLRGQAENGSNSESLKEAQEQNADRTKQLDEQVQQQEGENEAETSPSESSDTPSSSPNEQTPSENNQEPNDSSSPNSPPPNGDSPPPSNQESPPSQENTPAHPVQDRLKQAEQNMRNAAEKLEQAQQDQSVEEMREAEQALAEAKRELEAILRQLREEEIERELASLESRFRQMLEQQVKILDQTVQLSEITNRDAEFEIRAGKLAFQEKSLVTEANRALLVLQDDGTSFATTETVLQMERDMQQIVDRLSAAKVDTITQQIQQDIIETLQTLISAFAEAQKNNERQQDGQPPNGGQGGSPPPGEQPLVDQLAELKLLRGLQQQILNRHQRYAQLLANPDDPIGFSDQPEIQEALERLQLRQKNLQKLAREILAAGRP